MTAFKQIGLVIRQTDSSVTNGLDQLIKFLQSQSVKFALESETAELLPHLKLPILKDDQLQKNCDLLIVIGGDGSLLNVARKIATQKIPLLGINHGSLGFLTDIRPNEIESKISEILSGKFFEEKRFLLEAFSEKNSKQNYLAVNEIILAAKNTAKMIEFEIYIENKFMCSHRSDGIIVATSTGSTAYVLSGGGPIVHPEVDAVVILPMFPHTLSSRPIVIDANHRIKLVLSKDNTIEACLSADSHLHAEIKPGEIIYIQKTKEPLRLIHPADYDYFEALRSKLHWGKKLVHTLS